VKKVLFLICALLTITVVSGCASNGTEQEDAFLSFIENIPYKFNAEIPEDTEDISADIFEFSSPITDIAEVINEANNLSNPPEETEALDDLKSQIEDALAGIDGEWAVYVKNLETNEYMSINNHPMYSASLIKLFIMNAVYEKLESGELEKTNEVASLLNEMITVSDNDASNRLVEILGGGDFDAGLEVENDCTSRFEFADTKQQCDLQDVRTHPANGRNYTSVNDCGKLLENICRKNQISYTASDEMIDLLCGQQVRYKIPSGVPDDAFVANKTGEMTGVQNDAAIIYSPNCLYVLCVMSNELTADDGGYAAIRKIIDISSITYDYFN
jgi:beta-lactamase class A